MAAVAALVKSGDAASAGNLYKALYVLTYDLEVYQTSDDAGTVVECEQYIFIDFANIESLLSTAECKAIFGEMKFEGNTANADLSRLDTAFNVVKE